MSPWGLYPKVLLIKIGKVRVSLGRKYTLSIKRDERLMKAA